MVDSEFDIQVKTKIKKDAFGYDVFEQNFPFSQLEEGDVLLTTDNDAKRNHNWSFIKMNDDYIELIDQSYARLGKGLSLLILMFPLFLFYYLGMASLHKAVLLGFFSNIISK